MMNEQMVSEKLSDEQFERTAALIGREGVLTLQRSHVVVFGIGGVGSHCVLALARAGVGRITLVDGDTVAPSNINRQAVAFHSTLGLPKVDVARQIIGDINPNCAVETYHRMVAAQDVEPLLSGIEGPIDYIVDAIDTTQTKVALAVYAEQRSIPLISCAGTAGKFDAQAFEFADIYQTSECPLCKRLRSLLRKEGVERLEVLYSTEKRRKRNDCDGTAGQQGEYPVLGTMSYVPSVAGLLLAGRVIKRLLGRE